ncbi:MAG: catalase family peroxidase [Planctomycetota bacterium]|nr:catalase family peroxidase [Planctomycetota bacterium]
MPDSNEVLAVRIADLFQKAFGVHAGFRLVHAKGLVCTGTFVPTAEAAALSRAAHFHLASVPVVARFSNATGVPVIPDNDPHSNPKGLGLRFLLPDGRLTDIVANGQSGFPAATPADFVDFFAAVISSGPGTPSPTPLEKFLGAHPDTAAFLGQPNPMPASFATQAFFGNNAFVFVNAEGRKQATRYQIVPVAGAQALDEKTAAGKAPNFLFDELRERLAKEPVAYTLFAQLAEPGDPTHSVMKVWPAERMKVALGTVTLTSVDPKSAQTEHDLMYDPTHLIDGLELSDDPLPPFRAQVYSVSIERRRKGM